LGVLHAKSYSLPVSDVKALQKSAKFHIALDKLRGQSSNAGVLLPESQSLLHSPGPFLERPIAAAPVPVKASIPSQTVRRKPNAVKAPTTPHQEVGPAPRTPQKPPAARRRYNRKGPPR